MDGNTFRLESQPSSLLSRLDCSNDENVKDARHQLRRCATPADFERWAKTWGENLCAVAKEHTGCSEASADEMDELEKACAEAEEERDTLKAAIDAHIAEMDRVMEGQSDKLIERVNDVISKLENAL